MNFEKAYKELLLGKKIRRKEWEKLQHMRLVDGIVRTFRGEYTNFYSDSPILTSNGWIVIDGDGKELSFLEAIDELRNKRCLTHKDWIEQKSDEFIFVDHDKIAKCKSIEYGFMPTWACLNSQDWEILK